MKICYAIGNDASNVTRNSCELWHVLRPDQEINISRQPSLRVSIHIIDKPEALEEQDRNSGLLACRQDGSNTLVLRKIVLQLRADCPIQANSSVNGDHLTNARVA